MGRCPVHLRAFAAPTLQEPAVWDDHWRDNVICYSDRYRYDLGPGDTVTIERVVAAETVESWPPPREAYYGVVVIENGRRRLLDAGQVRR
jgi:hypothetical protein